MEVCSHGVSSIDICWRCRKIYVTERIKIKELELERLKNELQQLKENHGV